MQTKFQLNSSKYVAAGDSTLFSLPPPFTPPPSIEMPPKKGGFRGSVGGEVVEMKRNIKILNLVRNFT